MQKIAFAALALLTFVLPLCGQSDPHTHQEFDRALAIRHALEFNKDLLAARQLVTRAEALLRSSGLRDNPSIEVEYADDFAFHNEGEGSLGVSFSQKFPLARRLSKEKAVSRVGIAQAKMEVRKYERELVATICELALDVHLIDTRTQALATLAATLRSSSEFASAKVEAGEVSLFEANEMALDLKIVEQEILNLQLERERVVHRLAPYLGQPSSDHFVFRPNEELPYEGEPLPGYDPEILERHPEFQLTVLAEKSAEAEIALAKSANWEAVTARLFWKNEKGFDHPIGRTSDHLLGLSLSVPLPLRKKGDLLALEKQAQRDQSRLAAAALRFQIENDIEHARHEAELSKQQMDSYRVGVLQLAQSQLEQTRRAYENGQTEMTQLLRAQERRLSLENGYLDLYELYAHASLELQLARLDIPALKPVSPASGDALSQH